MPTLLLLLLAPIALPDADAAPCLASVEIRAAEPVAPGRVQYPGLELRGPRPAERIVDLDLGESVEGYRLSLLTPPGCATEHRVQWQFETSVTVMDEGPHVDLLDWKHHTAPWVDIEPHGPGRYRLPTLSEEQRTSFPPVSVSELIEAVRAEGGDRWAEMVAEVKGPNDYPSGVGLSTYRVRVLARDAAGWVPLYSVVFRYPMGC